MYELPFKGTIKKYFNLKNICKRNFCKSTYLQNLLDIFWRIDESKKFCEISFQECTKFYLYKQKKQKTKKKTKKKTPELTLCEDRSTVQKNSPLNFHDLKIVGSRDKHSRKSVKS